MDKEAEKGNRILPRPPEIKTTADFIVVVFVVMVATILIILTVGIITAGLFGDTDVKPYFAVLTDIMTTVIGALVGFLAGKGSGRAEVAAENLEAKRIEKESP